MARDKRRKQIDSEANHTTSRAGPQPTDWIRKAYCENTPHLSTTTTLVSVTCEYISVDLLDL